MLFFKAGPVYCRGRTACRPIRRSILSFSEIRVSRYSVLEGCFSLSLSLYPMYRRCIDSALLAPRSLHTRETRCYHVCPNNSVHAFDSSMFPAAWRERRQKKKRSLGLRYLLIAVTSAPNCTPKPEALPRPHSSPFSPFFSLFLVPELRRSRFCLSLPYLATHGSQLRVLSRGLLDERRLVRNSRSSSGGRLRILIRVPKYREVANLISLKKFARYDIQDSFSGILMVCPRIDRNRSFYHNRDVDAT